MRSLATFQPATSSGVWRACEWVAPEGPVVASGHPALDAELPGGGWPRAQLIDVLLAPGGQPEWRLLLPALREATRESALVLIGCPHRPHVPALVAQGLNPRHLIGIEATTPAERLWAAEQALHCHDLGALLVWLPHAPAAALRRLQLTCRSQGADTARLPLVFGLRPLEAGQVACAAPLRLDVSALGRSGLRVHILKRRGPPRVAALDLPASLPVSACLRHDPAPLPTETPHALDRAQPRQPVHA